MAAAAARRENKEEVQSVTGPVVDLMGKVSPWAQSPVERRGEKPVLSGRRRRDADEAWEHEHRSRLDDLCSRAENMSIRSDTTPRPIPAVPASPASQDSLDSILPKVTSTTRKRRPQKPDSYSLFDPPDSGYGSRGGSRSHRSHGSRAGSYAYSASPQSPAIYQPSPTATANGQPPATAGAAYHGYPTGGYYEYGRDHSRVPPPISLPRYSTY
ncbi:hypothetical protein DV735_g501, partial [Chaetothyriales sp. CBS 134920]